MLVRIGGAVSFMVSAVVLSLADDFGGGVLALAHWLGHHVMAAARGPVRGARA